MSTRLCFASRYTVPRKFRGSDSWNRRPLTMTMSPTVSAPVATPCADKSIAIVNADENTRFWPTLRADSDCWVARAASSYFARHSSYLRSSRSSLPKDFTCMHAHMCVHMVLHFGSTCYGCKRLYLEHVDQLQPRVYVCTMYIVHHACGRVVAVPVPWYCTPCCTSTLPTAELWYNLTASDITQAVTSVMMKVHSCW